ncbi:IS30 family transposase [Microbacterium sp. 2FI]|uniref:IS30 family transposase n=1 Tax=Microbacterium sp. 2FI TaxID=2502193 RepID=UPI0010F606D3|nr:IS30 family transposase [Microbacterium sp. 2FI]
MTDKRRQFLELLAEGWSVRGACTRLGISRSSGNRWKNGSLERQKDGTVKFVPPLEPLAARTISPRFLSEAERIQIADLASRSLGPTAIGRALGRAPSTISRELRRNLHASGQYRPFHAHSAAATRRRRTRPLKLSMDAALREFVLARLGERWSPQQIARALRLAHPTDPRARVATETIYQEIYRPGSGLIRKPEPSPLRTGRDHRRGQSRQVRTRRRFAQPMLSVHDRGFDPTDRSVAGHWEGDLIVGPHNRSAIGTLVERQTRFVKLLHLPAHNSTELLHALVRTLNELPPPLRQTVTWDQGTEMARHLEITQATGTRIYFCDSASPWQRGSNENANGLLRQYFPKSTDLSVHSTRDLARVENELNRRPRITLGDRSPADLFATLLASENHPSLR